MKFLPTKKKKDEQKDKSHDVAPTGAASDEPAVDSSTKKSRLDWKPNIVGKNKQDQAVSRASAESILTSKSGEKENLQKVLEENLPSPMEKQEEEPTDAPLENESTFEGDETIKADKITKLIALVSSSNEKAINPTINLATNRISYPILAKIGENEYDVSFLEKMASQSAGILERELYERLVVCPQHTQELYPSVRLYCPECSSVDVERLQLVEHRVCGYIAEKKEFGAVSVADIRTCPNCKRPIKDYKKEIRMPAKWNRCNACNKKFDNVIIKLHCRRFNHDFNIDEVETIAMPHYKLRSEASENVYTLSLLPQLNKILTSLGFIVEELSMVKGKSGMTHQTNIYAHNNENKTVAVFIKSSKNEIDDAEINSVLVRVLDIYPTLAIFIGIPSVSEMAKAMAAAHGMTIVTGKDVREIAVSVEQILSKEISMTTNSRMNAQ